ncbi:hypothetical protein K438DRAFT_750317 [Mycena galopus ATCC 62051]|nr:hypothetical protein K438DRAFT_750317 [Mycena galopus ATCC 62051]
MGHYYELLCSLWWFKSNPFEIPVVWDDWLETTETQYQTARDKYENKTVPAYKQKLKAWQRNKAKNKGPEPTKPAPPISRMQQGEDINFLRFATALKIFVGSAITTEGLKKAENLLCEYLLNFSALYGTEAMKPNHHWAVHIPEQNVNSNNWGGSRLEVSMMREFHRAAKLDGLLQNIMNETADTSEPETRSEHEFVKLLLGVEDDVQALGTIQDAVTQEPNLLSGTGNPRAIAGSISQAAEKLNNDYVVLALKQYYAEGHNIDFNLLRAYLETYNYFLLDGRRITLTQRSRSRNFGSCLVYRNFRGKGYAGELDMIFKHKQSGVADSSKTILVFILWMRRSELTPLESGKFIWDDFAELGIETWEYKVFAAPNNPEYPPSVSAAEEIKCQVARGVFMHTDPHIWVTTTMDRVRAPELLCTHVLTLPQLPCSLVGYGGGSEVGDIDD